MGSGNGSFFICFKGGSRVGSSFISVNILVGAVLIMLKGWFCNVFGTELYVVPLFIKSDPIGAKGESNGIYGVCDSSLFNDCGIPEVNDVGMGTEKDVLLEISSVEEVLNKFLGIAL